MFLERESDASRARRGWRPPRRALEIAGLVLAALSAVLSCAAPPAMGLASRSQTSRFPYRLVFVRRSLSEARHVEDIRGIVERSSRLGFNGVVLSSGIDYIGGLGDEYKARLREVSAICRDNGMSLIPLLFSVGYAGGTLAYDRNLAAAFPLTDVPFVMRGGRGVLVEDPSTGIANGGFEDADGGKLPGFNLQDGPGRVSFHDTSVYKEGHASLRLENFDGVRAGMGRVMQEITVRSHRCYRVALWVRTDDFDPAGRFQVLVMGRDGRVLMEYKPSLARTSDWREVSVGFNSLDYTGVRVYAGVWGGAGGRVWFDALRVEEVGLIDITRRPGTPVRVRNADTGHLYTEGEDYERIEDTELSYKLDHRETELVARPGGRIRDGERIAVDCYQALSMGREGGQVCVCMSEPRVYEIWTEVARLVHETIAPDFYFLSMDEIRQGGWCEACRDRGLSAGEILGDCVTRQCEILRGVNPRAEIFIWSDMLDPKHNARDDYYLFRGSFEGSWEHVPKDLIIACWYYDIRDRSLRHFAGHDFRTIGCGYYDSDDRKAVENWMASLAKTPGACGIMFTTWKDNYDFLDEFAGVVKRLSPDSSGR